MRKFLLALIFVMACGVKTPHAPVPEQPPEPVILIQPGNCYNPFSGNRFFTFQSHPSMLWTCTVEI